MRALLHFDFREKHCWGRSRHWHAARLSAADAIEDFDLVSGDHNAVQRRQRSSHNIDAPHQFIGAAVGINSPHQHRQNLKGLRHAALRQGESPLNVFEVESVGLALLLDFVDQQLPQLRVFGRMRRSDDQIALAAGDHQARLRAPVAVRLGKILDRHARHQKILENPVLDDLDTKSRHALVVVLVPAPEVDTIEGALGGIVGDAEEFRQDLLVDLLGEGLSFLLPALAVSFQPMAEHFVEKHCGRSPRK
jgi:hypothetical protein